MNKFYTLLLALLLATTSFAQTDFASFQVPLRNPSSILTAVNDSGQVCLLAFEGGTLYNSILNSQGQRTSSGRLKINHNEKADPLGLIGLPDSFVYFEQISGNNQSIQPYRIEKDTGNITALTPLAPNLDKGSELVQAYISDNKLYTLHYSNKTKRLQVCEYKNELELTVKNFNITILKLYDRLLKGENPASPVFIDKEQEQTLATSSRQKKIYHQGDNIYIVFDSFGAQRMNISNLTTEVLQLNLSTEQADFRALPIVNRIRPIGMNSYVHQGVLFRFLVKPGYDMQLAAYDLQTMTPLKEYTFKSSELLTLKATPVSSNKQRVKRDTTTVETTEAALRKLNIGTSTIFVEDVSPDVLQLTLGNYTLTSGPAGYLPNGTSLLNHAGFAALPVIVALAAIKVEAANSHEVMHSFNVYLNKNNFEQATPVEQQNYLGQISAYDRHLAVQKTPMAASFAYTYQGHMHYGYLNKNTNTIHIVAFSKK